MDTTRARRDRVLEEIQCTTEHIAARRGVTVTTKVINADPPAKCGDRIIDALSRACETHRASHMRMISRAYHDSLFMSLLAPTAMLFIPCCGGVSHRPDEYSSPEAIARGTLILAETLAELAK